MAGTVQSVDRAVQILDELGKSGEGLGLTELAARAGLPKSTALRLARTLMRHRLVRQDSATSRYYLGPKILERAFDLLNGMELRKVASPHMRALRDLTEETVTLAILDGHDVVFVDRIESQHTLRTSASIGRRAPAHCTSMGKVLLAYSDRETVDRILRSGPLKKHSSRTLTDPSLIEEQLREIRRTGVAVADQEYHQDVRGASAPVFDAHGRANAVICAHGPRQRIPLSGFPLLQHRVKEAAEAISRDLGWRAGGPD